MSINFIIAQIFGLTALAVLIISFQQNNKNKLLKYQTYSSLLYAIQYIFLGALTGCLMNLSCMARNYIFEKYNSQTATNILPNTCFNTYDNIFSSFI